MNPETKYSRTRQGLSILGLVLAIGLVVANADSIYGLLTTVFPIGNTGVIASAGLGVYSESQCVNNVSSINWGTLSPGQSKSVTVYVKNTGNVKLTLGMTTENWSPQGASAYLVCGWNYTGQQIQPSQVVAVAFTLTVSSSIQGISSFSFDVRITGTEAV